MLIRTTKAARQARIARVIARTPVHSQLELAAILQDQGIAVTQATLSRDLREMRASKVRGPQGQSVYMLPEAGAPGQRPVWNRVTPSVRSSTSLEQWIQDLAQGVDCVSTDIVVHTRPGAGQLLASVVDEALLDGVVGTIAGDDTVLILTESDDAAGRISAFVSRIAPGTGSDPVAGDDDS